MSADDDARRHLTSHDLPPGLLPGGITAGSPRSDGDALVFAVGPRSERVPRSVVG